MELHLYQHIDITKEHQLLLGLDCDLGALLVNLNLYLLKSEGRKEKEVLLSCLGPYLEER